MSGRVYHSISLLLKLTSMRKEKISVGLENYKITENCFKGALEKVDTQKLLHTF